MNNSGVTIKSHGLITSVKDKSSQVGNKTLLIIRVILSTLCIQRHLEKWEKGLCWYPHFVNGENKTLRPIFISTNFQLLKHFCRGWVLLSQEHLKDPFVVIHIVCHPISPPDSNSAANERCGPQPWPLPAWRSFTLVPASVLLEDQILLWLIGEGDLTGPLHTGSSDSPRKVDPCRRKLIFLELWDYFFCPWRDGRVMSRDFRCSPSNTMKQPRSPAKATQLSPNTAPS